MTTREIESVILSAPAGATVEGREIESPPGCARGFGGSTNRSRSRPGASPGDGLITSAAAQTGSKRIARAANRRRPPAVIPAAPPTLVTPFHRDVPNLACALTEGNRTQALG